MSFESPENHNGITPESLGLIRSRITFLVPEMVPTIGKMSATDGDRRRPTATDADRRRPTATDDGQREKKSMFPKTKGGGPP